MRNFRILLAAFVLMLTTSTFATTTSEIETRRGIITYEIEKMIAGSGLIIEDNLFVTVIFHVNEDKRIEIRSVKSPNEEVNAFLKKRLNNQKLHGKKWVTDKTYELPVQVQSRR